MTYITALDSSNIVNGITKLYSYASSVAGNAISNTTTETAFNCQFTIPANTLKIGNSIEIIGNGEYSTALASIASLVMRIRIGGTVVCTTGTISPIVNIAGRGVNLQSQINVLNVGTSGSVTGKGFVGLSQTLSSANFAELKAAPTINTTIDNLVTITMQWGTGVSGNDTISITNLTAKLI